MEEGAGGSSHSPASSPMPSCPRGRLLREQPSSSLTIWLAGARAAKAAFYVLETTVRSQNSFRFSKGSLLPSEGFPPCPRRGKRAVLGGGPEVLLAPLTPQHGAAATGVPRVGWSRQRRKEGEEGKGEEAEGPLPLKCPTPARCGRGTACSRG